MNLESIFQFVGGIGFFFFGMRTMSNGLKKSAGEKLKQFLHAVTKHRIYGIFVGALVTVLVQSSSVTTVFVVGFVNASLIGLKQAITLIMGANIGTTFTAWLVSFMSVFKISHYALPAVGIGFALDALCKQTKYKNLGQVILGFGLLFVGLDFMKDAFAPLKSSNILQDTFLAFSNYPLLGVLAGMVFTVLLQSSSATIAIVQLMAFNGLLSFDAAIPIILGDNIGTTITAQMAAIGTNLNARRAAMSHTIFNSVGVAYMLFFVYVGLFSKFVDLILPGKITTENIMVYIAVAHSTFNVVNTIVFLPLVSVLERLCIWLVPKKGETIDYSTQYLEEHLLNSPSLALEQVHNEIAYMLKISRKAVDSGLSGFLERNLKHADQAGEYETVTDNLQDQITQYIVRLSQRKLDREQSQILPVLIHNVNDLERIGDHSQNIAELTRRALSERMVFSKQSVDEIQKIAEQIYIMFDHAEEAFKNADCAAAERLLKHEKQVDRLQEQFKKSHVARLNKGVCKMKSGFVFLEVVYNFEKIGDRLTNIAQSVIMNEEDKLALTASPDK